MEKPEITQKLVLKKKQRNFQHSLDFNPLLCSFRTQNIKSVFGIIIFRSNGIRLSRIRSNDLSVKRLGSTSTG
jgi:hypothetical protein